jgi:hypothetical protein
MLDDPWDDDEDWYDEDDADLERGELQPCPECGAPIEFDTDKCLECGYWVLSADRRALWPDRSIPGRLKLAVAVLLVVLLSFVLLGGLMML